MTLKELSSSSIYLVFGYQDRNRKSELSETGGPRTSIFYPIYTDREIQQEPSRKIQDFLLPGEPESRLEYECRGGFYYVGAMHDSFPMHWKYGGWVSWF